MPGRAGSDKVSVDLMGVTRFDKTPDKRGLLTMEVTDHFSLSNGYQSKYYGRGDATVKALANPKTDIGMYISTTGAHSVVYYDEQFWVVMACVRKYDKARNGELHLLYQAIKVLAPKSEYVAKDGKKTMWPGIPEESEKFLKECVDKAMGK
jgi:hypothetical protein